MASLPIYPIKFHPILKEKVWGGTKFKSFLNKSSESEITGESWELSGVNGNVSTVANGPLKGMSITELIETYTVDLLGEKVYKNYGLQFPLLFKFIDAREILSVQLHPDDKIAKAKHNSFGKTEMWYIVQADDNAELIIGFSKTMSKEKYLKHVNSNTLEKILNHEKIKKGDVFFIPPGLIHAIGAGTLLAEIQQSSDITYRVYDWNRPDTDGNLRALHHDLALDAINFNSNINYRIENKNNTQNSLVSSSYFDVNELVLKNLELDRNLEQIDSFVVYMCVEGHTTVNVNGQSEELKMGETILFPAITEQIHFQKSTAKVLEIFVPS